MYSHTTVYRVCYADTDQMGYMYYGNYARLFEIARTDSIRNLGYTYKSMEEEGVMMPVYENYSKYLAPALYDDLLTIKVTIQTKPSVRMVFHYEIYNESGKLIHTGHSTLVFMNVKENKITKPPLKFLELISPFFK